MVKKLVPSSHELLRTKLEPFSFVNPPVDPIELANELIAAMIEYKGLGISANQLGLPYRVFAMRAAEPLVCFNPRIVDWSDNIIQMEEGCLSYPYLFVPIKRPSSIKVRFQKYDASVITEKFTGMTARIFQHELDHLQGTDFTRRANPIHLERAKRQQVKLQRAAKKGLVGMKDPALSEETTNELLYKFEGTKLVADNKEATV